MRTLTETSKDSQYRQKRRKRCWVAVRFEVGSIIKRVNNSKQQLMQRRQQSRSPKKSLRRPSPRKPCQNCLANRINQVHISRSLYRKYSFSQNHLFLARITSLQLGSSKAEADNTRDSEEEQEFLGRYHRAASRKTALLRVKEMYRLHRDLPRLFLPGIAALLAKCHHRKRLIDYFKLAKILGIKVESLAFSSFMLSLHKVNQDTGTYSQLLPPPDFSASVEQGFLLAIEQG